MTLNPQNPNPIPTSKPELNWLFKAEFADGHVIKQDPDDKCHSRTDGTGSAFSDVLAAEAEHGRPTSFALFHRGDDQMVGVDLRSGNFIVNGTPICAHNQFFDPARYELELVYFRETRVQQDVKATVQEDGSIEQIPIGEPRHFINRYFIGWKTEVNGKSKQTTVAVG